MRETVTTADDGLRARKREDTRRRLHEVARELVLRDGFAGARLEEICSRVNVAPRTFFNYFNSKEDAVVGRPPSPLPASLLEGHRAAYEGAGVAGALVGLVMALLRWPMKSPAEAAAHGKVLWENPDLLSWQLLQLDHMRDELVPVVANILQERTPGAVEVDHGIAEAVLVMCLAAVRNAFLGRMRAGSIEVAAIENEATSTVLGAVGHLSRLPKWRASKRHCTAIELRYQKLPGTGR